MMALCEALVADVATEPFVARVDTHVPTETGPLQATRVEVKVNAPGKCTAAPPCASARGFATGAWR